MVACYLFLESWLDLDVFIVIILLCIFLLFHVVVKYHTNKLRKEIDTARTNLRKTGTKIPLKYDELEIKTNCWAQEIEVDSGTESRNEHIDINLNVIIFEKTHRGHHFKEEYRINMEPEILRMKLALQNEVYFYYNANNFDDNFLDLDFLFKY